MSDIEATKFYIRHRDGFPDSDAQGYAVAGFRQLGIETASYDWIDDIDQMKDLGRTVGVAGFVGDVHHALRAMGKPIPENVDYPPQLVKSSMWSEQGGFLGREIREGTLEDVRRSPGKKVFIKPIEHKAFSGFVWTGDSASRRRVVTHGDETPIYICDPMEFVAEYRSFILNGQVIDCRKYAGAWWHAPNHEVVHDAVKEMGKDAPRAYCLDWGVVCDPGKATFLIEMNEGYSFGHYGLPPVSYARMLSARWHEMTR